MIHSVISIVALCTNAVAVVLLYVMIYRSNKRWKIRQKLITAATKAVREGDMASAEALIKESDE